MGNLDKGLGFPAMAFKEEEKKRGRIHLILSSLPNADAQ